MSRHRFLVDQEQIRSERIELRGDELKHLKVRRIEVGEEVMVIDGAGIERPATVEAIRADHALLQCRGAVQLVAPPPLRLILVQALLKGDKLDLVVEKACELGAEAIFLLHSERVIAGLSTARHARLERVAQSAAKQSQQARIAAIEGPMTWQEMLTRTSGGERLLLWEEASRPLRDVIADLDSPRQVSVIVGPEGGFTPPEAEMAESSGCRVASLGTRILRAETAAIAALAVCQYVWDRPHSASS